MSLFNRSGNTPSKTSGVPINCHIASMGAVDASICHPREILKTAILANAAKVILVHNHPKGFIIS